ncbi:MAG: DedA family protein [Arsenophonus sp. ET-YP4-MAG3]
MKFFIFIIDFIIHIDFYLAEFFDKHGILLYAILFFIIFCETGLIIAPFLPGDSLLFFIGALTALKSDDLNIHLMVILIIIAAIIGDSVNYTIGRLFSKNLFNNKNSKIFRRSYLEKTHQFYKKYGSKTIILARFIPIIRTFAPFIAGMVKMSYRYFSIYNVIGALLWVLLFTYAGYFFGSFPIVQQNLKLIILIIILFSFFIGIIEIWRYHQTLIKK